MAHTTFEPVRGTEETTGGPRDDAARLPTNAELDTTAAVGEQLPRRPALVRTWAPRRSGRGVARVQTPFKDYTPRQARVSLVPSVEGPGRFLDLKHLAPLTTEPVQD